MARIDDYINAKRIAVEKLSKDSFEDIVKRTGFEAKRDKIFRVPFLDRVYSVDFPNFEFTDKSDSKANVPIQEQVLILHYMMSKSGLKLTGRWVAYREIKGASFYFSAFVKRAIDPLKNVFGKNIEGFKNAAAILDGKPSEPGDAGFEFYVFPKAPIQIVLWEGDDEFPSEANILFDNIIEDILSPEDIAWLTGMLVYRLIKLAASYKSPTSASSKL